MCQIALLMSAQTYTVNQQSQQVNINVPVIEKPVYIERYRTVYVEKPRVAKKLDKPVQLLGYLWVYPEDLGNFKQVPAGVIKSINAQKPYGRSNWRIPTPDELAVMEANAEKIGLGDDIYLATDHRNGVLRLVCIDGEDLDLNNFIKIGDTYWAKSNFGTTIETEKGRPLTYQEALEKAPAGYRLPTEEEALGLIYSGEVCFGDTKCKKSIFLSYTGKGHVYIIKYGAYWVQGDKILCFALQAEYRGTLTIEPYIMENNSILIEMNKEEVAQSCCVRYVKAQ